MPDALLDDCRAKWGRYFDCLDADGDGRVDGRDHAIAAERMIRAFRLVDITGYYRRRLRRSHNLWLLGVGNAVSGVSKQEFCDNLHSRLTSDKKNFLRCLQDLAVALAEVGDADGDGRIELDEFLALMESGFGIPHAPAQSAFARLDLDGNGYLEHGEIQRAVHEFFTPCARSRSGNWLLGPPPWNGAQGEAEDGADES